ncbi:MAG: hypothetical protein U0324_14290 [Polyangiales bacterium]
MAGEEKKKPDLRSRLNKGASAGATASSEPVAPPTDVAAPIAPPPAFDAPAAPPAVSGIGDDIAVPDFIRQQQAEARAAAERAAAEQARLAAERAAAERAAAEQARLAAIAADPFSSSAVNAGPQEVRLVIDDKAVADSEVGRKNTGTIITAVATGFIALAAGYLIGDFKASKGEESRTRGAITDIRRSVDATGTAISTLKDKVDRAAAAAGVQGEEGQAPAQQQAAATLTVDEGLAEWFATQSPDPPLGPDAYAGRVGRLRPDLVAKLMKLQIGLEQVWRELQRHQALSSGPALTVVRASLADAQRARTEYQRLAVVFGPGRGEGAPPVMGTLVQVTPQQDGSFQLATPVPGAPARQLYQSGDLAAPATIGTVIVPVSPTAGLAGTTVSNLNRPWADYAARLRSLKQHVDQLQQDHHSLGEALSRAGVN